jgi:serine/threonine protein kinase
MLNGSLGAPFNDLWSLGVIIYQILAGEAPWKRFHGDNTTEYMIYQYIRERRIEFPNNMPLEAVDLIDKLL